MSAPTARSSHIWGWLRKPRCTPITWTLLLIAATSDLNTEHHLIVAHEVTNVGTDRSQLAHMGLAAKAALHTDNLDAVADRGYFKGEEILACEKAGITVTLPKPQTSGAKSEGRFGKPDFVYLPAEDVYRCPAGEKLTYRDRT